MSGADILWKRSELQWSAFGRTMAVTCEVRTLANGLRKPWEIVYSLGEDGSSGVPYQPALFPLGLWVVGKPRETQQKFLAPWFVPVGAAQKVEEWSLVRKDGVLQYGQPTGRLVWDFGYGAHVCPLSRWTQGCARVRDLADLLMLVAYIQAASHEGRDTFMEVT